MRKVQTTLTRIFIVLESVSHGFSENQGGISQKSRNFKHFTCPRLGDLQKKKKKVFTDFETGFSTKIGKIESLRGGCFPMGGGYFQFFTKNRPQKHQKRAILHTSQSNGGLSPPTPLWLRYCTYFKI